MDEPAAPHPPKTEAPVPSIQEDDFFHQVTTRICGDLDIAMALWRCQLYLERLLPLDEIFLDIWDMERCEIRRVAHSTRDGAELSSLRLSIPADAMALLDRESRAQTVRIYHSEAQEGLARKLGPLVGLENASDLCMALKIEDRPLGGVILRTRRPRRYLPEHVRLLALVHEPFAIAMANAQTHREALAVRDRLAEENLFLSQEIKALASDVVGGEGGLSHVMEMVQQIAALSNTVLLLGETGVGKEVIAGAIHRASPRRDAPFIKVNCGAIPESLIDSELFGHEKGAFTGALNQRRGHFERAQGGTLLLDEIGELPPAVQARLLRVLQSKEIERVGGSRTIPVDIRIIAATHRDLETMVREDRFREDLWFRLNVFPIIIPPLRHRRMDIPLLAEHARKKKAKELGIAAPPELGADALERLRQYDWPGNVRELENLMERELIRAQGAPLRFADLPARSAAREEAREQQAPVTLAEAEARQIEAALNYCDGKVQGEGGAAEVLWLNPSTLRNRMNRLGIPYGRPVRQP